MRLLPLVAAALLAPLAASAEPLKGIPADVDIGLHISYDEAAKSQLHPTTLALQKRMEKVAQASDPAGFQRNKELMERLGIKDNATHVADIGLRVTKGKAAAEGETPSPDFSVYAVIRMDLRKAALDAFAKDQGVCPVVMGDASGWESGNLVGAILKAISSEGAAAEAMESMLQEYALVMPEDNVVLLCPVRDLAKTVACWRGKSASYEMPAGAQALVAGTPLAHTQVHASLRKMVENVDPEANKKDKSGLNDVTLAIGEDAKSFLIRANVGYVDDAKAKVGAQEMSALLGVGNLATVEEEGDDEDTKYFKAQAGILLSGITVKQEGAVVAIRSAYPLENAKVLLGKFADKIEQTLRETTGVAKAPGGQANPAKQDEEMDAPAAAPTPKKTK